MRRISAVFGRLFDGMMLAGCVLLLAMTFLIGADVLTRNLGVGGIAWSNEVSENLLYVITLLAAPWLLRQGQHIRVDILLRVIPPRVGWLLEWVSDLLGLACSIYFVWYGWKVALASYRAGAVTIKTLVTPEWWLLALVPIAFLLVAIEFVFRMQRLSGAERAPRADAVAAS
jgi:TRAP-type C4-dicarboxylate transport system permease small subunit